MVTRNFLFTSVQLEDNFEKTSEGQNDPSLLDVTVMDRTVWMDYHGTW